jgi:hypothetical protein
MDRVLAAVAHCPRPCGAPYADLPSTRNINAVKLSVERQPTRMVHLANVPDLMVSR